LDWKPPAKAEDNEGENSPEIELNQIKLKRFGPAKPTVVFAHRNAIGNRGEDKSHQRPTSEEECGPAQRLFKFWHQMRAKLSFGCFKARRVAIVTKLTICLIMCFLVPRFVA